LQPTHIAYAKSKGVTRMTFDNADELRKIAASYPGAEAVLRILTDDSASVCRLGLKFGAPLAEVCTVHTACLLYWVTTLLLSYSWLTVSHVSLCPRPCR
jgi:diaminopimelate decarboxylase